MDSERPSDRHAEIDAATWSRLEAQDLNGAAEVVLSHYGPAVYRLMRRVGGATAPVDEAFSVFCERVWRGLKTLRQRRSLRAWVFACGRNALRNTLRANGRRGQHEDPLTTGRARELAAELRTATAVRLDRQRQSLDQLVAGLDQSERTLLLLRIEERLNWREIAEVLADDPLDAPGIRTESARHRKRYQRLVQRLRARAEELDLVERE